MTNKKLFPVDEQQFNKHKDEMQQWIDDEGLEIADIKQFVKDYDEIKQIIDEYATKYADRKGGYTRIVKIAERKGDGALEVFLELV